MNSSIEPEHLYKALGLFLLILFLFANMATVSRVLLIVYAAVVLAVALNVVVGLVPHHRKLVSAALGLLILVLVVGTPIVAAPALAAQLRGLTGEIPRFQETLEAWSVWIREQTGLNIDLLGEGGLGLFAGPVDASGLIGSASGLFEVILLPLVIIIGAVFAVARPNKRLLTPLLQSVPRERRDAFRRLFALLGDRLRGWVKGVLIGMMVVGILVGVSLWLMGIRYALLLGVMAGLFEIIPIFGPWVSGAVAVAVALLEDPTRAIWVALLMLVIQQVESNLITPLVMSKAAEVHPFVTLFSLLLFGGLFGFLGLVLAIPLVLLVWTIVEVLWVERAIEAADDVVEPLVQE